MQNEASVILFIEDDATLAEITAFRLELLRYQVKTVHTADQALTWLQQELPDVILLDLALSGADGLELVNQLSNAPRTSHIPIMVFSTDADLGKVQKAYTSGAKDFLLIPYDPLVLENKLEKLLESPKVTA
jgi:CheY-like chemotaxis protein